MDEMPDFMPGAHSGHGSCKLRDDLGDMLRMRQAKMESRKKIYDRA